MLSGLMKIAQAVIMLFTVFKVGQSGSRLRNNKAVALDRIEAWIWIWLIAVSFLGSILVIAGMIEISQVQVVARWAHVPVTFAGGMWKPCVEFLVAFICLLVAWKLSVLNGIVAMQKDAIGTQVSIRRGR